MSSGDTPCAICSLPACSSASVALTLVAISSYGKTPLPVLNVETAKKKPPPKRTVVRRAPTRRAGDHAGPDHRAAAGRSQPPGRPADAGINERRDSVILPEAGATSYQLDQQDLDSIPQGKMPPRSAMSCCSFPACIRTPRPRAISTSQRARKRPVPAQRRSAPDGVSGFSQLIDTSFIKDLRLLTGALPANTACTAGVIELTSKSGSALAGVRSADTAAEATTT